VMMVSPRKAFLLAAGHGRQLRPLTDAIPKCLLPIAGVPMLQIWLSQCRRFGTEEVLINLHSHADQVREFLERSDKSGVRVQVSDERSCSEAQAQFEPTVSEFLARKLSGFSTRTC